MTLWIGSDENWCSRPLSSNTINATWELHSTESSKAFFMRPCFRLLNVSLRFLSSPMCAIRSRRLPIAGGNRTENSPRMHSTAEKVERRET